MLSDISILVYLRSVCLYDSIHSLLPWPCQFLLGANVGSMPVLFIVLHNDRLTLHKTFTGGGVGVGKVHKNVEATQVWNGKMKKVFSQRHSYLSPMRGLALMCTLLSPFTPPLLLSLDCPLGKHIWRGTVVKSGIFV
jgi:hypothetical protein